ncbi:MAG TPA: organomercurial lyase, partial [Mycobacterium sp.]|nr:organomercurial lyase [Mycobacterium sp.]
MRGADGRTLWRAAVRLLARGGPVTVDELGVDAAELAGAPAGKDIEYDDQQRIVGWGLTLVPTPHRFIVDGRLLYTWCAADTLLFPAIIGRRAHVESVCPTTDTEIRLTVDPDTGVADLTPAAAVISLPPSSGWDASRIRNDCCNPGRFFANAKAAADWRARYPTGTVLPV